MSKELSGYKGTALKILRAVGAQIGDIVQIAKDQKTYEGMLMPRSEFGGDKHVVIKLKSGYNIGIRVSENTRIGRIGEGAKPTFSAPPLPKQKTKLPKVTILGTGGTIASRVDYRTGGVRPALSARDLYSIIPELSEIAVIRAEIIFNVFSENITPKHWLQLARHIGSCIENGVEGVVIAHGTDTLGYTSAALSFAVQNLPIPVVLVGAQRSSDRPSSDAAANLIGAVKAAAEAPFAEVVVAMHETVSDTAIVFHQGTKVRKCHTSRRDAFKSINVGPIARMAKGKIEMFTQNYRKRGPKRKLVLKPFFDENVALLKFYPGINPGMIEWSIDQDFKGIVMEGTGLGHVSRKCFASLKRAVKKDIIVGMTSQCIWGRTNMNVYDTGRDLQEIGVIPLEDMLPETAFVKMMWAIGNSSDVNEAKKLLRENVANEFESRTVFVEERQGEHVL